MLAESQLADEADLDQEEFHTQASNIHFESAIMSDNSAGGRKKYGGKKTKQTHLRSIITYTHPSLLLSEVTNIAILTINI